MVITACPTDIVAAPRERIWELLIDPAALANWSEGKLVESPGRALQPGDRVVLGQQLGLAAIFEVLALEPPSRFVVDVRLPFGVVNHEVIEISPAGEGRSRVTFN